MKRHKFYKDLTTEQKRKLRGQLDELSQHRLKQIEIIEKGLIKPLKDCNKLAEQVRKNMISLERYVEVNEIVSKRHREFFALIQGDTK